jgi:hypothetical protein
MLTRCAVLSAKARCASSRRLTTRGWGRRPSAFQPSAFSLQPFLRPLPRANAIGAKPKPPENRQNSPVDALRPVWQDGAAMTESENQFSLTRAASSTSERVKKQIPISCFSSGLPSGCRNETSKLTKHTMKRRTSKNYGHTNQQNYLNSKNPFNS